MEDKQYILDLLLPTLQATEGLKDLVELKYEKLNTEWVIAVFVDGTTRNINVNYDSGLAMINDVLGALTKY